MEYRKHRDLSISEVGVGCYALSGSYGRKDIDEFRRMLVRAHELGINFFDTAEAYGSAEDVLGKAIEPFRSEVVVATKVGIRKGVEPNLSKSYITAACEESLRRLDTDYIDLYQVHFDDPTTPVEETVEALEGLKAAGKIRHYGLGHLPAEKVKQYLSVGEVFSVLVELSAVATDARNKMLPLCRSNQVGVIAFSVTGRGLLTGRFKQHPEFEPQDIRNIDPLFRRERFESGLRVAIELANIGKRYGKTPAQVAIAWVLAQAGIICALCGPSTVAHLEENVGGSGWQPTDEDLARLEDLLEREAAWVTEQQKVGIKEILSGRLVDDPHQAFSDLIYAMETAISLDLTTEAEVLPTFKELYALRGKLDDSSRSKLEEVRDRLRSLIGFDDGDTNP